MKTRVTGIGGIFFKARDKTALDAWYQRHLGFDIQPWGGAVFPWKDDAGGMTLWTPFAQDTAYFRPSEKPYMLNLRVADLDGLLATLKDEGVAVIALSARSKEVVRIVGGDAIRERQKLIDDFAHAGVDAGGTSSRMVSRSGVRSLRSSSRLFIATPSRPIA